GRRREELLKVEDPELVIANFISQLEAEDATNANQANCRSALGTLFQLQGFKKEKINGVALHQIMKKPQAGMRKPIKEEQIWNYDQLLKYIKSQSDQKVQLSEIEFLGIVIATIMGYSTLRLIEVHRAIVLKLPKGCRQVKTATFKGHDTGVTNRVASYEETSKAVHIVMNACKIPTGYTVISIRSSSMTKQIDQGTTKTEINRATRHRKGSQEVANHYDKNLNDKIRTRLAKL
ncbi:MAG: hypothetical protein EZS28_035266, partial [Streblomastix strix]